MQIFMKTAFVFRQIAYLPAEELILEYKTEQRKHELVWILFEKYL